MPKRKTHLDVAKGIGILLVFLGHLFSHDSYIGLTIYSFHMPLFFIVSGVFAKTYKEQSFIKYFKSNVIHLLVPFVLFTLFGVAVTYSIPEWRGLLNMEQLKIFLYTAQPENWHVGQLWFLPSLFMVKMLFWFYQRIFLSKDNTLTGIITVIMLFVFAYNFYHINIIDPSYNWVLIPKLRDSLLHYREITGVIYPFQINSALMALPFYTIGYLLRDKLKNFEIRKNYNNIIMTVLCLGVTIFFSRYNGNVNLGGCWYNDLFLYVLFSLTGTFGVIGLSSLLCKSKYLAFLGRESMLMFGLHTAVIYYFTYFLSNRYGTPIINSVNLSDRDCIIGFILVTSLMSGVAAANLAIKRMKKTKKQNRLSKEN